MNVGGISMSEIEWECCKNVGFDGFVACGRPATKFYRHGDSICSYCDEHDYVCGQSLERTDLQDEAR
jgi:hypothetical protein